MAEEGTIGLERASRERGDDGDEPSKEELQRRMEEARESISQTVTEIKEAVTNQYNSMKETVTDALDWRHHFRKNPVAFSVGALSVGFLVGYTVVGRLKGGGGGREDDYPSYEESDLYARTGAVPAGYDEEYDRRSAFHGHSYAAQPITDSTEREADYAYSQSYEEGGEGEGSAAPRMASAAPQYAPDTTEPSEQRPGLLERFKGTSAYDRLEKEVSSLGDRFIDELSTTAHTVVLPALFNKLKELFGVDLSGKKGQSAQGAGGGQTAARTQPEAAGGASGQSGAAAAGGERQGAQAASASASLASASRGSGASGYATSENVDYGTRASGQNEGASRTGGDSILDLDR